MDPQVPRLNLVKLDPISATNPQRRQPPHAHPLFRQASDLTFSVHFETTGDASPHDSSSECAEVGDDQRFQHAQDSFRQLLHRKSSVINKDAVRTGRRHTVTEPPELTRRETIRPRSLFDAQDSVRDIARRQSLKRLGEKRRWTLPSSIKAPTRIYVTTAPTSAPPRQSTIRPPQSTESCAIL